MKGLLSFTILALVASGAYADVDCSAGSPDHQPHPTDCSKYYTCSNGIAILQDCPAGLWWSVALETCVLPANADCDSASTTTVTTPTTSTSTSTISTTSGSTPPTEGSSTTTSSTTSTTSTTTASTTTTASPGTDNQCPPIEDPNVIVRYPHETNCVFYYRCEKGKPTLYSCMPSDEFSPTKRVCMSAKVAGCDSCPEVEDVNDVVRLPHETNCHFYYLCKAGVPNLYQCKEDLHFSRSSRDCMEQSAAKCTLY